MFNRSSNNQYQEPGDQNSGIYQNGETSYPEETNGEYNNGDFQNPGEEEEIPLLEDLDIDIEMVKNNLKAVILFKKFEHRFTEDPDMTGPLIVGFSLALALILVRKYQKIN